MAKTAITGFTPGTVYGGERRAVSGAIGIKTYRNFFRRRIGTAQDGVSTVMGTAILVSAARTSIRSAVCANSMGRPTRGRRPVDTRVTGRPVVGISRSREV